jgi:hypothetical protein
MEDVQVSLPLRCILLLLKYRGFEVHVSLPHSMPFPFCVMQYTDLHQQRTQMASP